MAGTKYTRKPKKKVAKKDQSITQRGVKKKSNLKRALKNTAKGIGKGAIAVASVSPWGTKAKALKVAGKVYKVAKNKLKRRAINKAMKKGGRDGIIKSKLPSPAFERRLRKGLRKEAQKEYGTVGGVKWMKKSQKSGAVTKRGKAGAHPAIPFKGPSNKRSYDRHLKYDSALEKGGKSLSNGIRREAIDTIRHNPSSKMAAREIARRKDKVDTYKKAKTMSKYTKKIAPKAVGLGIGAGGVAAYNKKVPNKGKKNGSF
jgi:hypothetical protein